MVITHNCTNARFEVFLRSPGFMLKFDQQAEKRKLYRLQSSLVYCRISSASLKQTIANSIETGMILGLGGYECELISLLPDGEPSFEKIQQPVPDFTPISSITLPACKRSFSKRVCS